MKSRALMHLTGYSTESSWQVLKLRCLESQGTARKQWVSILLVYCAQSSFHSAGNTGFSLLTLALSPKDTSPLYILEHVTFSLMSPVFFKAQDWLPSCNFYHPPVQLQTTSLEAGEVNCHNCKVERGRTLQVQYIRFSRNACWDYETKGYLIEQFWALYGNTIWFKRCVFVFISSQ